MLDWRVVEIRQKSYSSPLAWSAPAGFKKDTAKAELKPADSGKPATGGTIPLGESVTLSTPGLSYSQTPVEPKAEAPGAQTFTTPVPKFEPQVTYSNGPLSMGLDMPGSVRFKSVVGSYSGQANGTFDMSSAASALEPVYIDEIRVLESRYPGVADKLKGMEIKALEKGYCPEGSKGVEASVLESPPWPTTEFGDPRTNIGAKAKELHQTHPHLNTNDASTYDFKKAASDSDKLMEKLDGLFGNDLGELAMSTRAKTPKSLSNKMDKMLGYDQNFTMGHLTDTVGARIDAPDLKSMGEVAKRLEKEYEGKIIAKSDYVSKPGDNGYRAIHYIIDIGGRMAEIQTSTQSLRTADLATHDTVYKAEFPVTPETSKELSSAADRIMFLECLKAKE